MYVIKRDGKRAPVEFDKITARISKLCYGLSDKVQSVVVAQKVRCRRWQPSPLRLQASNALAPSRVPSADRARPAHQVCAGVYPDVTTAELDDLDMQVTNHTEHFHYNNTLLFLKTMQPGRRFKVLDAETYSFQF